MYYSGKSNTWSQKNNALIAFYHPDYTVGFGIAPNHAQIELADYTAGRDLHPAPKANI